MRSREQEPEKKNHRKWDQQNLTLKNLGMLELGVGTKGVVHYKEERGHSAKHYSWILVQKRLLLYSCVEAMQEKIIFYFQRSFYFTTTYIMEEFALCARLNKKKILTKSKERH